jgi:hypothetical protein
MHKKEVLFTSFHSYCHHHSTDYHSGYAHKRRPVRYLRAGSGIIPHTGHHVPYEVEGAEQGQYYSSYYQYHSYRFHDRFGLLYGIWLKDYAPFYR